MPGGTAKYGLPYLLNTEGLWTIGNVTKLLAERLEALIDNGTLKGNKGDTGPAGGPTGPACAIVLDTAFSAASGSIFFAFNNAGRAEVDMPLTAPVQTFNNGLIPSQKGLYLVTLVVPWGTNNANGVRVVKVIDDASGQTLAEDVRTASATVEQISQVSVILPLAAGQKLNAHVYQNSGSALTVGGVQQGKIQTRFSAAWLGPTN